MKSNYINAEKLVSKIKEKAVFDRSSNDITSAIDNIAKYLEIIKQSLDSEELEIIKLNIKIDKKFIIENFLPTINELSFLIERLPQYLNNISKDQFLSYQKYTKEKLDKYFMVAPFPKRAFTKPLGFAGDYKMMYMIQELEDDGDSLFSKFINVFYTNIPISNSVKNRTETLSNYIEEAVNHAKLNNKEEVKILSLGCGPALEIRNYLRKNKPEIKCEFNLLDFNRETLDFAHAQSLELAKNKNCTINLIEKSVYNLTNFNSLFEAVNGKCDFIYCAGLFDYLSDRLCKRLVGFFYELLDENGKIVVTNMHKNTNDRYLMELLLDWHLIYRKEEDMLLLLDKSIPSKTYTDPTKVNLCLEIKRK